MCFFIKLKGGTQLISKNNIFSVKCRWNCTWKGTLMHCWWKWVLLAQPLWKIVQRLLGDLKNRCNIWPNHPFPGNLCKWNEISIWEEYLHTHVFCNFIHNSLHMESIQMSINGWQGENNVINVSIYIYTYTLYGTLSSH